MTEDPHILLLDQTGGQEMTEKKEKYTNIHIYKFRLFSFAWYQVWYECVNKVDDFIAARGIRFLNLWLIFNQS